ncbi:MAG: outer membrane lipoprotein carrier protein LolA [Bacilli bacterium]|nr:outer membrane lipoprotein carrier protein LolA [Bacilli bacterium]
MKKLFIFLGVLLLVCGCGKYDDKDLLKDLSKKVDNSSAYHMTGTLEIYRNEEKYTYNVDSSYKKGDLFKVNLTNQNNNHEQVILKNKEGVYVITPSLNKSFKFQSDWPYNNSQIYLLQPILSDLNNDTERIFEKTSDGYVLTSKVNYSSERDFNNQKIYIDKDKNITKVEVLDSDNNIKMCLTIIDIDFKAKFDDNYFDASSYQKQIVEKEDSNEQNDNKETTDSTTSKIEDIVYPMYVPVDTQLSGQDIVETTSGERVILTFTGESAFTVVQETLANESSTNYVYGDPYLILDTVGSITDYSVSWISNGVEYSVMSDTMEIDELLTVAQSISVKAVSK